MVGLHFEDNTVLVTRGKQWRLFFQVRQSRHKLVLGSFIILVIKTKISATSFRMDFQITLYLQHVSFMFFQHSNILLIVRILKLYHGHQCNPKLIFFTTTKTLFRWLDLEITSLESMSPTI